MCKKYFFRMLLAFAIHHSSFIISNAQWYNPDKVNKKAGDIYGQAYEEAAAGNYAAAIRLARVRSRFANPIEARRDGCICGICLVSYLQSHTHLPTGGFCPFQPRAGCTSRRVLRTHSAYWRLLTNWRPMRKAGNPTK